MSNPTINPMLAVTGGIDHIDLPADQYLCQPKLNGIRAIWDPDTRTLHSRNGNQIHSVDHIVKQLVDHPFGKYPLDGELYTDALSFQRLNGLARRKQSTDETAVLEFHVFDIAASGSPTHQRLSLLNRMTETSHIKLVNTDTPLSHNDIKSLYRLYIDQGHEGIILREKWEGYHRGRSSALIKVKPVLDMEAELIGFEPAEKDSKNIDTFGSLVLKLENGVVFRCSAGLTHDERHKLWMLEPIGATVTFKYGALSDDGTPVFPRYSHLRWDTVTDDKPKETRQKVTGFISQAAAAVREINDDALLVADNWDTITADEAGVMLQILRQFPQCERFDPDIPDDSREAVDLAFVKLRNALTERARMEV